MGHEEQSHHGRSQRRSAMDMVGALDVHREQVPSIGWTGRTVGVGSGRQIGSGRVPTMAGSVRRRAVELAIEAVDGRTTGQFLRHGPGQPRPPRRLEATAGCGLLHDCQRTTRGLQLLAGTVPSQRVKDERRDPDVSQRPNWVVRHPGHSAECTHGRGEAADQATSPPTGRLPRHTPPAVLRGAQVEASMRLVADC